MTRYLRRFIRLTSLGVFFLWELVLSSLQVTWDVITPRHLARPGILAIPLDLESDTEITLLANLISLTPGSLSLEVTDDRKTLYIHSMFVDDPEKERQIIKTRWEAKVREAFE